MRMTHICRTWFDSSWVQPGLWAWKAYLASCLTVLQANEMLQTAHDELARRADMSGEVGEAYMRTCQNLYGRDKDSYELTKGRMASLIGKENSSMASMPDWTRWGTTPSMLMTWWTSCSENFQPAATAPSSHDPQADLQKSLTQTEKMNNLAEQNQRYYQVPSFSKREWQRPVLQVEISLKQQKLLN